MHPFESVVAQGESRPLRSFLKLVALGAFALLLLIPVSQILGLVHERELRREEVRRDIGATWGQAQTLGALALVVPYRGPRTAPGGPAAGTLVFLPASVRWQGALAPQVRHRGLFGVTVYDGTLEASGSFTRPDPAPLGVAPAQVDWNAAQAVLLVSDPRGLQERPTLRLSAGAGAANRVVDFVPAPCTPVGNGLQAPLPADVLAADRFAFRVALRLRGSQSLHLLPLGDDTAADIASTWPDPSFVGGPLPRDPQIGPRGFRAAWSVPYYGRGYPQRWRDGEPAEGATSSDTVRRAIAVSDFGVDLVRPVDPYQQTERAVKYAMLFVLLTFTTVFVLELLSPVRLHPMSYLLVGAALSLFYLLLLALGEHVGVPAAYAIATAATVSLVALYARAVLAGTTPALVLSGVLGLLYGWLYVVLRAEDYALLLGAAGLFAALAAMMFLTRRLDWSTLRFRPAPVG